MFDFCVALVAYLDVLTVKTLCLKSKIKKILIGEGIFRPFSPSSSVSLSNFISLFSKNETGL